MIRDSIKTACAMTAFALAASLCWQSDATAQSWPNEPSGSTLINDWNWSSCPGGGWQGATGCGSIVSDSTGPFSPSGVLQFQLNPGQNSGGGDPYLDFTPSNEIYVGFWWKPSNPFDGLPHFVNKVGFLWTDVNYGQLVWYMFGSQKGGPYQFGPQLEMPAVSNSHLGNGYGDPVGSWNLFGNTGNGTIPLGQWNRIEIYAKNSTTPSSRDGILRWWMNGVLVGNYTTANLPCCWRSWQFTPAWDGSFTPIQTSSFSHRWDHIRISKPNGGGGAPKGDTTPPVAPVNLRAN